MATDDEILRIFGFKIFARPEKGPAIWILDGTKYDYNEALHKCQTMIDKRCRERRGEL